MSLSSRRAFCVLVCGLTAAGLGGCNTPTLPPLPPPDAPQNIEHLGNGEVMLQGVLPTQEAKLFVLNTNSGEIAGIFTHDARYAVAIRAREGDFMHLWYSTEGLDSPLARFEIPPAPEAEQAPDDSPQEPSEEQPVGAADSDAGLCPCR